MRDLDQLARAAAEERLREAREHLQRAQHHLDAARQALSPIAPEPSVRIDLTRIHDRCHDAYYRLVNLERSGRFDLDSDARERLAKEAAR